MYRVMGIEKVNYVNRNGVAVNGTRLHCAFNGDKIVGLGAEVIYCAGDIANHVDIDDKIEIYYNKYGKVSAVSVTEE